VWTNESYPADAVSLRSISSDNFVVIDTTGETRVIGETDFTSGPSTLHPKAIYIVEGQLYQVERLDFDGRKAFVREIECDYYTTAITYPRVTILETFAADAHRAHGEVHVVSRVVGFKKIKFYTNENVGSGDLDLPEQQMHTTSYWLTIPSATMAMLPYAADDRRDGVVGLAYAIRQVAQLFLMCDRHDIGISIDMESASTRIEPPPPEVTLPATAAAGATGFQERNPPVNPVVDHVSKSPQIFIYDNYPGGIGFSAPLFRMHHELLSGTRRLIADCECENGCPGCVGPIGDTGPLAKTAALRILELLIALPLTTDATHIAEATLEHAG
jgi:DEAD/DEAH box helicase domain-containing protein